MGYLFLSFSLLAGVVKGYCGKKMSSYATDTNSAVLLNTIRMAFCLVFSILLVLISRDIEFLNLNPRIIFISSLSGISTSVFLVSWLLSVRKSAYMMLDVFLMLGTLVPMLVCRFVFDESITAKQWIGYCILIIAVITMCSYNNSIKVKITVSAFLLLIACGFANGIADLSQKMFVREYPDIPISIFNLYTYFFAASSLGLFCLILTRKKPSAQSKTKESKKYIVYIIVMSLALIVNSLFKTQAATYLDSARLYPLNQGVALTLSTLMAAIFFKEKLNLKCIAGILLAFIGLLIMNVL